MRFTSSASSIALAIWLILYGLIALLSLSFEGMHIVMGLLAVLAGVLLLVGR
jgi:hypothetical protein